MVPREMLIVFQSLHFPRFIRFTFLDDEHVIVKDSSFYQPALRAYRFGPFPHTYPAGAAQHATPICSFWLHAAGVSGSGVYASRIACRHPPLPSPGTPFSPDPAHAVISLYMYTRTANYQEASFVLLVPVHVLRAHIDEAVHSSTINRSIEWAAWGETVSLLLHVPAAPDRFETWARSLPFGSRFTLVVQDSHLTNEFLVKTFDLNPWAAKYASREGAKPTDGRPFLIDSAGKFHRDSEMQTELPYVAIRSRIPYASSQTTRIQFPVEHVPNEIVGHQDGFTIVSHVRPSIHVRF